MKQRQATSKFRFVALQPGDATLYEFFFGHVPEIFSTTETTEDNEPISEIRTSYMFSGWGTDMYMLGMCRTEETKVAFVSRYTIDNWRDLGDWRLQEIGAGLGSNIYTAKVLLAALSVLLENPEDTTGACQRMMEARQSLLG